MSMEQLRIDYIVNNHPKDYDLRLRNIIKIYRKCVVNRLGQCKSKDYRIRFIKSIREIKVALAEYTEKRDEFKTRN